MNEKLTPLEAFENIIIDLAPHLKNANTEEIKIVETTLKNNNQLQTDYDEMDRINDELNLSNHQLSDENVKLKKALKIIKEHRLDIDWFLQFVTQDISYKHYVYCVEQGDNKFAQRFLLSEEEYELLKEFLK